MRRPPLRSFQPNTALTYVPQRRPLAAVGHDDLGAVAIVDGEETFADLFEASLKSPKKAIARRDPEVGELVQGEVVQIGGEYAFLDIGAKAEALISLDELRDENQQLTIQIGDKLEGHVVTIGGKEGEIIVSGKLQRGAGLRDQLRLAHEQGIPVEGVVTGVNKGGLDMDLGGVRAFLPVSQIELRYCQEPGSYVGRAVTVKVIRFDEDARNVVVSRKAILEVEQRAMAERTREKLVPGAVFNGIVTSVQSYGAFVDIGGLEGLVHVSELGYGRGLRADEAVKPGQRVEVVLLKVDGDPSKEVPKISLSLKALMADPMDEMISTLKEGDKITGKVVRLEAFGAFVELMPGAEGLIHISAMAERHVTHPREVVTLGAEVTATVISVDRERRRIGLSLVEELRAAQVAAAASLQVGSVVKAKVERVEPYGVVMRVVREEGEGPLPKGVVPNAELGVPKGADTKRLFPVGREVVALVQGIEGDGNVRMSIRAAEMKEERDSVAAYTGAAAEAAGKATMAEMLRSKLGLSAEPVVAAEAPVEEKAQKPKATRAKKAAEPVVEAAAAEGETAAKEGKEVKEGKEEPKAKKPAAKKPAAKKAEAEAAAEEPAAKAEKPKAAKKAEAEAAEEPAAKAEKPKAAKKAAVKK